MDVTTSVLFKQSLVLKADQVCFLNIHFNPKTNFLFVEKKIKGRVVTGNLPDRHVFGGKIRDSGLLFVIDLLLFKYI